MAKCDLRTRFESIRDRFWMAASCFYRPSCNLRIGNQAVTVQMAPHVRVSRDVWKQIIASTDLREKIEERQAKGCNTKLVWIDGASRPGANILRFTIRGFYNIQDSKTSEVRAESYHVTFTPNSAALLLHLKNPGQGPEEGVAICIDQYRYAFGQSSSEWTAGISRRGEPAWKTALRELREEALGKDRPEGVLGQLWDDLEQTQRKDLVFLGEFSLGDPGAAQRQSNHAVQFIYPEPLYGSICSALNERQAGLAAESEHTSVVVSPLKEALDRAEDPVQTPLLALGVAARHYRAHLKALRA